MIVRILGEGQFEVPDKAVGGLDRLDHELVRAVDAGDAAGFARTLEALLAGVRTQGRPVSAEHLGASDLVVPHPGATLEEVRKLLSGEGLIVP